MRFLLVALLFVPVAQCWAQDDVVGATVAKVQSDDQAVSIVQGAGAIKLSDFNSFDQTQRLIVCRSALLELLLSNKLDLSATKIESIASLNGFARPLEAAFTKNAKLAEKNENFKEFTVETFLLSILINAKLATAKQ